jgi:hypothetical protein
MRVCCNLGVIKEELRLTMSDLCRELRLDARTIEKLIADTDDEPTWRLSRGSLHRYFLFAHRHGIEPFKIEPHAIWKNFENSEVTIFRGPTPADVPVESHLVEYLKNLHCQVRTSIASNGLDDGIEGAMQNKNCVFIGSPKANPATEVAIASLWGALPFNAKAENRARIPIRFVGMQTDPGATSSLLEESTRHGIAVSIPTVNKRAFLKTDWMPPEKFGPFKGTGEDSAVLVVCERPLGAQKDVSTIVIAGYTGLATLTAAQEATYERIPDFQPEATPGQPCIAALRFTFRKRRQYNKSTDNLRTREEGSGQWAPPWDKFLS